MADSMIQKLEYEAYRSGVQARTQEARTWFQKRLKDMGDVNRHNLLKDPALIQKNKHGIGNMYMFFYDPKHRATLPYYDAFPLVIVVDKAPGGFYGLNLHYLPHTLRAKLFDALLATTNNKRYDETTKFKLNYQLLNSLKSAKYFKPCFKHYLAKQVDSQFALVESPEWEVALFMPTEQFRKASTRQVWKDSRSSI